MSDRKEYIERDSIVKAVVIQQDKERKDWMEHLQQLRGTKDYSSREIAVDNWLRGYNESVQYLVAKTEEMTAADVVEIDVVAEMLYQIYGDDCPCNFSGVDEWLPEVCDFQNECPYPKGEYACWKQYIKHYGERKDGAE